MSRSRRKNIFLTGMMGSGKSTVGKRFAERTNRNFIDIDSMIERRSNESISQIFERIGESGFRSLEADVIEDVCGGNGSVVALGGGAILNPTNLERIKASGLLVYLKLPVKLLGRRVGGFRRRPLLDGLSGAELIAKLDSILSERSEIYERAHIILECSDKSKSRILDDLIAATEANIEVD